MHTFKLSGKEYTGYGSGETAMVFEDEFHIDMFAVVDECNAMVHGGDTKVSPLSKMMYALIKTANPESFRSYREFMQSVRVVGEFVNEDNIISLLTEVRETMRTGRDEEAEKAEEESKKKTVKTKG